MNSRGAAEYPHLAAGAVALAIAGVLAIGLAGLARVSVGRGIRHLALNNYYDTRHGLDVQRALLGSDDLLPVYGSSELFELADFRADRFFARRPTGFAVAPVGDRGIPLLLTLQRLGAVTRSLHGRKIAILLSTSWLLGPERPGYAPLFSPLQAGELVFQAPLSRKLKQRIAKRMLGYPATIQEEPILHWGLLALADSGASSPYVVLLVRRLWEIRSIPLQLESLARALVNSRSAPTALEFSSRGEPSPPDWPALMRVADSISRKESGNNSFGVGRRKWRRIGDSLVALKGTQTDAGFADSMSRSPGWGDLELLVQLLQESGARPLIMELPLTGPYLDYLGVSAQARANFYQRFEEVTRRDGITALDFREFDGDTLVLRVPGTHPSPKGWILYDRALDSFYHDSLR